MAKKQIPDAFVGEEELLLLDDADANMLSAKPPPAGEPLLENLQTHWRPNRCHPSS